MHIFRSILMHIGDLKRESGKNTQQILMPQSKVKQLKVAAASNNFPLFAQLGNSYKAPLA